MVVVTLVADKMPGGYPPDGGQQPLGAFLCDGSQGFDPVGIEPVEGGVDGNPGGGVGDSAFGRFGPVPAAGQLMAGRPSASHPGDFQLVGATFTDKGECGARHSPQRFVAGRRQEIDSQLVDIDR